MQCCFLTLSLYNPFTSPLFTHILLSLFLLLHLENSSRVIPIPFSHFLHVQVSSTLSCGVAFYLMPFLSFILRHVYIGVDISCSKPINSLVRIILFTWSMFLSQFSCAKIPLLNAGVLFPDNSLISIYSVLCYTLLMKTQNIQNVSALLIL